MLKNEYADALGKKMMVIIESRKERVGLKTDIKRRYKRGC